MYGSEILNPSLWWICPILMIAMCFFMMRRRRGSMMCGFGFRDKYRHYISTSDSATDILDKLYASGKIDQEEYEERKRTLSKSSELYK